MSGSTIEIEPEKISEQISPKHFQGRGVKAMVGRVSGNNKFFTPNPTTRGSAPGPRLGQAPDPHYTGSRARHDRQLLAHPHPHPPNNLYVAPTVVTIFTYKPSLVGIDAHNFELSW